MMNPARAGRKILLLILCMLFLLLSWNTGIAEGSSTLSPPYITEPYVGGYIPFDEVTYKWHHPEHGNIERYHLQIDTSLAFTGGTLMFYSNAYISDYEPETGLVVENFPNDGTKYYSRVRAFKDGQWSNWSTTRSFTNGKPVPPDMIFPKNGIDVTSSGINFNWYSVIGCTMYRLQVSTGYIHGGIFFGEIVHDKFIHGDDIPYTINMSLRIEDFPNDGTKYYWRMQSYNPNAYWGEWSEPEYFYSGTIPPPAITSPVEGAYINEPSVTVTWAGVDSCTGYLLQYSTSSSFYGASEHFIYDYEESYKIDNLPQTGQTYYYRIKARHWDDNRWGKWSEARSFINGSPPPDPPGLSLPVDQGNIAYPSVHFKWDESTGATKYQLQVSTSEDFNPTFINDINVTGTAITKTGFPNDGTTYYWRVAANSNFGWSAWSEVRSFVNGYDYDTGSLRVFIEPKDARRAGAQWSLVVEGQDPVWQNSGETIENLAVNDGSNDITYTVEFKAVEGWGALDPITTTLVKDVITAVTGYYTIDPPVYLVELLAVPTDGGSVTGHGSYEAGTRVTVTATANTDYDFVGWTENGRVVSTKASYRFNVESDRTLLANFQTDVAPTIVDVTLTADPEEGGTVKGGGTYLEGDIVVVTASANRGYSFVNWTKNDGKDDAVSANEKYSFIMGSDNIELTANFQTDIAPTLVDVTLTADPKEGGKVQGGGTYLEGDLVAVTATANRGYSFFSWTDKGGKVVSYSESYSFTIGSSNCELVANFQADTPQTYGVAVFADPLYGGSVEGGGSYQSGDTVTVAATPARDYSFVNWTEDGAIVSRKETYSFKMGSSNRRLVANFQADTPETYSVYVAADPLEVGRVAGGGDYKPGARVTVTATPDSGYNFISWTEFVGGREAVVSESEKYTFTMESSDRYLVANFHKEGEPEQFTVSVKANPEGGGSVKGGGQFKLGDIATVSASADNYTGYIFINWTEKVDGKNVIVSKEETYSFKVNSDRELEANFETESAPELFTVSVEANPEDGGKVEVVGGDNSHEPSNDFQFGDKATVNAAAENGYEFVNWTENGQFVSSRATYSFVVDADRYLVANFHSMDDPTFTVSLNVNPEGYGIVKGGGSYKPGELVTIMAAANEGYEFVSWTEDDNVVSTSEKFTFKMGSANRDLVANFRKGTAEVYAVAVSANPTEGGKVSGGGNYETGTEVTVCAAAAPGYTFVSWTEGDNVVSTSTDYTFTVESNRKLVANFEEEIVQTLYTVYLHVDPEGGGTVRGEGDYETGTKVTVAARANKGYVFHYWGDKTGVVSKDERYTFIMGKSDIKLVAYFQLAP